jgi:hypothetical protein
VTGGSLLLKETALKENVEGSAEIFNPCVRFKRNFDRDGAVGGGKREEWRFGTKHVIGY